MGKHDLTSKKTTTKTSTMTMTNTYREHLQRAISDTFELWGIWSEWWGNMTWPTKRQQQRQTQWRVWPLFHCYESDSSRPNWWGLTKFHNCGQISQSQPNFTILEYLEYLELGQFRNICDVFCPAPPGLSKGHNFSALFSRNPSLIRVCRLT